MQEDVVPRRFMIGELLYAGQEERWGTNLKGQRLKPARPALHKQAFCQGERSDGSARRIADPCDMCTIFVCRTIATGRRHTCSTLLLIHKIEHVLSIR